MSTTPTPGQVAYTAYVAQRDGMPAHDAAFSYAHSAPAEWAAWEAAVQAAITAWIASPDELTPATEETTPC